MVKQYWWKLYTWRTWHSITPWFHIILDINASQLAPQVALIVKNPPSSAGDVRDVGSISGSGRSPGGGMATHSSILSWRISWMEEHVGLQSIGLQGAGHDWSNLSHVHTRWWAISALSTSYLLNSPIQQSKYVLLFSLTLTTSLSCSQQTAFTLYWDVGLHLWTPSNPPPVFLAHSVRGFTWIQLHL